VAAAVQRPAAPLELVAQRHFGAAGVGVAGLGDQVSGDLPERAPLLLVAATRLGRQLLADQPRAAAAALLLREASVLAVVRRGRLARRVRARLLRGALLPRVDLEAAEALAALRRRLLVGQLVGHPLAGAPVALLAQRLDQAAAYAAGVVASVCATAADRHRLRLL
jgi:hypothetical protein